VCAGKVPAGRVRLPARSAGSLPAGRLPAGPGDPLDEPGWSLGSEDQAGTTTATSCSPEGAGYKVPPAQSRPACCLQDRRGSSTACWRVLSLQLRSDRSSSQCAPVGPSGPRWNDRKNDMPAAPPHATRSRVSAWSTTHPTPLCRPRWCEEADANTVGVWTLRGRKVPPKRIGVVLWLRKKQDPGSLQGPGPDHAAPRKPPATAIFHR
jgi:hypothetical protein